ncbi:YitT family protein [uncultured Ruthenibacterium sp.]|uniref:YitT family protein n=1 Tax=uncultured Ruthenibacterium sp. TaxID=1905347 RepID=UPI00349EBB80
MKSSSERHSGLAHYGIMLLGAAILSFGLFHVHDRTKITEGGVLGMMLLLQNWTGLSPSLTGPCMDFLCYLLGLRFLGKDFLKNAIFSSLAFAVCYRIWEFFGYLMPDLSSFPLVAAVVGGIFVGVGVGLVVREGGASGGDDALAMVISRFLKCPIERAYFATDFTVLLLSLSYIPVKNILFSLVTVTLSSFIIGRMQRPFFWERRLTEESN